MRSVFRHVNLNRIGAALSLAAVLLLAGGAVGLLTSAASGGSASFEFAGLRGGQAVLVGLACLVASALAFGQAVTHERLARVEAKLDALAKGQGA